VNVREYLENDSEAYYSKDELLEPLTLIYNSLLTCGDKYIAHGRLLDCIRQVTSLCPAHVSFDVAGRPAPCWPRPHPDGHVPAQVTCFGMGLVTLDVRQESSKHTEAIDTVTQYLGLGSYKSWDEEQRLNFLIGELTGKRPLMPPGMHQAPVASADRVRATDWLAH
jgi:phosphoenolpyruvate carboxylase